MKLIVYTLDEKGRTPGYVANGGYYPIANGGEAPQDYDMIGLATRFAPEPAIENVREYLISIGAESWLDSEGEPFDIDAAVNHLESLEG